MVEGYRVNPSTSLAKVWTVSSLEMETKSIRTEPMRPGMKSGSAVTRVLNLLEACSSLPAVM